MRERSDRSVALVRSSNDVATRGRGTRWPWLIVAVVVGALKVDAYESLLHHRGALIGALALALLASVVRLRPKPLLIAALTAALVATTAAPHPVLAGVGVGFGAFAVLIALFFTISTVLHARQRRSRHARPG